MGICVSSWQRKVDPKAAKSGVLGHTPVLASAQIFFRSTQRVGQSMSKPRGEGMQRTPCASSTTSGETSGTRVQQRRRTHYFSSLCAMRPREAWLFPVGAARKKKTIAAGTGTGTGTLAGKTGQRRPTHQTSNTGASRRDRANELSVRPGRGTRGPEAVVPSSRRSSTGPEPEHRAHKQRPHQRLGCCGAH